MGRPRLLDEEKHNTVLQIRINTDLKARLEELAKKRNMSVSDYLRNIIVQESRIWLDTQH